MHVYQFLDHVKQYPKKNIFNIVKLLLENLVK